MSNMFHKSFEIAEDTIKIIRENAQLATPASFELWYTHIAGENPYLSEELKRELEKERPLAASRVVALHKQFFGNEYLGQDVLNASDGISEAVAEIITRLGESGNDYKGYCEALSDAKKTLADISDKKGLSDLVTALAAATETISSKSADLEKQLEDASHELITLREDVQRAREEAYTDGLTGVANRKRFDIFMSEIIEEVNETGENACLILGDVDHFKTFNDRWGHQVGDQVLKLVAAGLKANVKGKDLVARYGGEEFAVVLPSTELSNAKALGDKLRTEISARRLTRKATNEVIGHITISFGVAVITASDDPTTVVERADICLYEAKNRGRNRVVGEDDSNLAA
ncbi:MAG: GGDEF domain-containing protein [Pseudomonadota bacterium]